MTSYTGFQNLIGRRGWYLPQVLVVLGVLDFPEEE